MFKIFANAWKVVEIRKKIFYVILIIAIYRLGCHIPLPGIDLAKLLEVQSGGSQQNWFSFISGGGYGSIFQIGIGPYITSSIIMQLLTVAIPKLEQIQKEGEEGRKKISQYTRIVAVALAFLQGGSTVYSLTGVNGVNLFVNPGFLTYVMATVGMVTGTIFIMWLGELLTEKAIGNGTSFIIFANILSGLPTAVIGLYTLTIGSDYVIWLKIAALLVVFTAVITFVILVQSGERRIPVQYSKKVVGRGIHGAQNASFIPIKVNIAGVMSIIFAISLLQFPSVINQFVGSVEIAAVIDNISITKPIGAILYVFLIFCFTFFYTSFAVNPIEMAENIKKSGGFIPGIRPGKPTSEYMQKIIDRLSWIGALFYAVIAMVPVIFEWIFKINVGFGGTTLLIVTGVAMEIVKQLESQLLMRHYKGFLN